MIVLQQADAQIGELSESASFEAENCLELIELTPEYTTTCGRNFFRGLEPITDSHITDSQQAWTPPTLEATQSYFQETGPLELPTYTFSQGMSQLTNDERISSLNGQDFQLSEHGIFNTTRDPPMSFRDRHRFLDGVYNSCPDPTLITAEDMGDVARKVGLLMEEVLSWFKDEKSRRAELHAHNPHQAQKSPCQFPPSPESIRGSGDVSPASSSYNATSPRSPSKPQDISPCLESVDQKILAPPKAKRGRPAKTHVKIEPDLLTPDAKRTKISVKYPCPDCRNFVPVERWAEHINRTHFPKHVWECPKTSRQTGKPCSSSSHYRPAPREDNFATHLKGEHKCSDAEVAELKKIYKFEVTNFFHKICGFCDKYLDNREESIEHIKDHFRKASEESNPPVDLGVSLWKEKCGVEHKLQRGIHYGRSQASKIDPADGSGTHDRDEDDDNEDSGNGNSDNSAHDNSAFRSNNNSHDHDANENGSSGDGNADNSCRGNSADQPNNNNHAHHHDKDSQSSQDSSDSSGDPPRIEATSSQDNPSIGRAKMDLENASDLPSISSVLGCFYDRRSESQERDSFSLQAPRSPTGIPRANTPQRLTAKEDANFQCHVEGCGTLFNRCHDLKARLDKKAYPKTTSFSFSTIHAEAPQYIMESPELRAPSNYSSPSGTSAGSSALDSPFSIPTPQNSMWTRELRTSSKYSTVSGLSAVSSSSIGSPHSIHGHTVSGQEFGFGSTPRIASYDNFGPYNDYTFSCGGMDDFTLDFNPSKLTANGFVGK